MTRSKLKFLSARKATAPSDEQYCDGTCCLSEPENSSIQPVQPGALKLTNSAQTTQNYFQENWQIGNPPQSDEWPKSQFSTPTSWEENSFQSLVPASEDSDDSITTDDESIIFDLHEDTLTLHNTVSPNPTMDLQHLTDTLSALQKEQAKQWHTQLTALVKNLEQTRSTPTVSASNSMLPKFSGSESEDVTEFLTNFERAAQFYKFSEEQKAQALPLYLTSAANVWFNTTPGLADKPFDYLANALKKQFHTESDIWLLRQQLHARHQMPTERVSEFAATIRRLCRRLELPPSECLTVFIQNLRPELKNYVLLQRPHSIEEAEMHAKLKESLPDAKPSDRFDELLSAIKNLQPSATPTPAPVVASYAPPTYLQDNSPRPFRDNPSLSRDEISQMIRQEVRRATNSRTPGQIQRGRRTFDGRPICDFCNRAGHVMAVCRQRQTRARDPRIPYSPRQPGPNQNDRREQSFPRPADRPALN